MTTATDGGKPTSEADSPWRSIVIFLVLTACLSGIFWAFIDLTQTVTAMQSILFLLTSERADTKWVAGDLGLAFVVVAFVVVAAFWAKRDAIPRHQMT